LSTSVSLLLCLFVSPSPSAVSHHLLLYFSVGQKSGQARAEIEVGDELLDEQVLRLDKDRLQLGVQVERRHQLTLDRRAVEGLLQSAEHQHLDRLVLLLLGEAAERRLWWREAAHVTAPSWFSSDKFEVFNLGPARLVVSQKKTQSTPVSVLRQLQLLMPPETRCRLT